MISPSQRPLPDNTQHSQQTNIHAPGGIRTHDRSRQATVDLRLRPRGYWDRSVVVVAVVVVVVLVVVVVVIVILIVVVVVVVIVILIVVVVVVRVVG